MCLNSELKEGRPVANVTERLQGEGAGARELGRAWFLGEGRKKGCDGGRSSESLGTSAGP